MDNLHWCYGRFILRGDNVQRNCLATTEINAATKEKLIEEISDFIRNSDLQAILTEVRDDAPDEEGAAQLAVITVGVTTRNGMGDPSNTVATASSGAALLR